MSWISRAGVRRILEGVGFDGWDFFVALVNHQRPEWNFSPLMTTLPTISDTPGPCRVLRNNGTQWEVVFNGGEFLHFDVRNPFIGVAWQGNGNAIEFANVDPGQTITGIIFGVWHGIDPSARVILGLIDDVAAPGGGRALNLPITVSSPGNVTLYPNLSIAFRSR